MNELLLELKSIVVSTDGLNVDDSLEGIANKYRLELDKIRVLYENLYELNLEDSNAVFNRANKKMWGKKEDNFLMEYVYYNTKKTRSTKVYIFEKLASILFGRTSSSIQFRYYELRNKEDELSYKRDDNIFMLLDYKSDNLIVNKTEKAEEVKEVKEDLLDIVIEIVDNVDSLGLDVSGLFKGLFELSNSAIANNKDSITKLELENMELKKALENERKDKHVLSNSLNKMRSDLESIKKDLNRFEILSGKNKIKNLNGFRSNVGSIVNKY